MRSRMRLPICLIALAALVFAAVAASAPGASRTSPTVKPARLAPLVVTGTGFGRHSWVRVTVTTGSRKLVKSVTATSGGAITARFAGSLTLLACRSATIDAVARNGLEATRRPDSKSCLALAVPITATG